MSPDKLIPGQPPLLKCRKEITREEAIKLWRQKRKQGWQPCEPQWTPPPEVNPSALRAPWRQHGGNRIDTVLLQTFYPLSTAKLVALKVTAVLLLTLLMLIKAKIRITDFSALGIFQLQLQILVFLAISICLMLAACGAAVNTMHKRRPAAARPRGTQSTWFPIGAGMALPYCAAQ